MKPKNVRLFLQISPERAKQVVGRLWACGELSREQYERNMRMIDRSALADELRKNEKHKNYSHKSASFTKNK